MNGAVYYLIFTPENITSHYRVQKCRQIVIFNTDLISTWSFIYCVAASYN